MIQQVWVRPENSHFRPVSTDFAIAVAAQETTLRILGPGGERRWPLKSITFIFPLTI